MDTQNNQNPDPAVSDSALDDILALEPKETPKVDTAKIDTADGKNAEKQKESDRIRWSCRNCHYHYEGYEKLSACPRCGKDPSYFEDVE